MNTGLRNYLSMIRTWGYRNVPVVLTKDNVNDLIIDEERGLAEPILGFMVRTCWQDRRPLLQVISLGATITDDMIVNTSSVRVLHLLFYHGGNPNAWLFSEALHELSDRRVVLAFEHGAQLPTYYSIPAWMESIYLEMDQRMHHCRRALLTLIWLPRQLGYDSLTQLFITWAQWIWALPPYTLAFHPNMGPRSPVWSQSEREERCAY